MSIKDVIKQYEVEAQKIKDKILALEERAGVVALMLKELGGATRSTVSAKKPAKKTPGRKKAGRKKGGLTVRDAILNTVADAKSALTAKDIIDGAVKLSGGAVASIRTQINSLAKGALFKQVPYEGRGFRYTSGGEKPVAEKPAKKVVKKPAKKAAKKPAKK